MDVDAKALVVVDLKTGLRSLLASGFIFSKTDIDGNDTFAYGAMVLDKTKGIAYAAQTGALNFPGGYSEIVTVNLSNGEKKETNSGPILDAPADIVLDKNFNFERMFVSSVWEGVIIAWDLDSGQTTYSKQRSGKPNKEFPFSNTGGMAVDRSRNRILMSSLNSPTFVYAIDISKSADDITSGARSEFSNSTKANCADKFPVSGDKVLTSIRMDEDRSRALMVNREQKSIIALAVSNEPAIDGSCSKFSDSSSPNALIDPYGLHVEAGSPYALVVDKGRKALLAIDLESGERVFVSKQAN
ncbi:MAG TPA: hypothetical protein PKC70_07965, partial [Cellvibrionaceae bacterium]|nr:hypothetical protein [Cellvibrionaceae bacterium]